MDYIQKYREALARARELSKTITGANYEYIFPELKEKEKPNGGIVLEDFNEGNGFYKVNLAYLNKEQVEEIETMVKEWNHGLSEDEKVRKALIEYYSFDEDGHSHALDNITPEQIVDWLKKQGESVEINPDEIIEECHQDNADHIIDIVTEQEKPSEWSEEDENGLGDALWAIKQARTIAKDENDMGTLWYAERWLKSIKDRIQSKQSSKPQGKSATEAIKKEKVDNTKKVETTFKVSDWVVRTNGESFCNGNKFAQIESIELDGEMCYLDTGRWLYPSELRLWTIYDAQDGDLIYVSTEEKSIGAIFDKFDNGIIYFHCYICGDFTQGGYMSMDNVELIYPWQKANHQRLFQKMKEAGFDWDNEKKELKKIMGRNETN